MLDNVIGYIEIIVFGFGCFWGVEKWYEVFDGVLDVVFGYVDGSGFKVIYRNIMCSVCWFDENNYVEVVKVIYNSN